MARGFAKTLKSRRKQGPSAFEKSRNIAWQTIQIPIRRFQGHQHGVSDPNRFANRRTRSIDR